MPSAITARSLGKRYAIGGPAASATNFREALTGLVMAPWTRYRALSGRAGTDEEFWALRDVNFEIARHPEFQCVLI